MYVLTERGKKKAATYISEMEVKRKKILEAELDTANETTIPSIEGIESDINAYDLDDDGEYFNSWGVTDKYNADYPLLLRLGDDIMEK